MRTVIVGVIVVAAGIATSGQKRTADPETAPPAAVRFAQSLVATAYPELTANRLSFVVEAENQDLRLSVREVLDPFRLDSSIATRAVVSARVAFDTDGLWRSFEAEGSWVRSDDYAVLRERVRLQPFQSSGEADAWLAARGAGYGPNRGVPLDERLKRTEWGRLLQATVNVQSAGFRWTDPPSVDGTGKSMPGWVAILGVSRQRGSFDSYEVLFEPFTGRVVRIRRE